MSLRQHHITLAVVYLDDLNLQLVAYFRVLLSKLGALDDAIGLVANVHVHFVIRHLHHGAGHSLTGADSNQRGVHFSHKAVLSVLLVGGNLLFLVDHACDNLLK